jgi:hypothetical protein
MRPKRPLEYSHGLSGVLTLMIGFEHAGERAREFEACDDMYVPTRTTRPERQVGRQVKTAESVSGLTDHAARKIAFFDRTTEPARFDQKANGQKSSPPIIVTGGVSS